MLLPFRWKIAQTAELIWWKKYLRKRTVAEYLEWKQSYWKSFLEKTGLSQLDEPHLRLLDAGCGPAGIFMVFQEAQVEAVDPLLDAYEKSLLHFKKSFYPTVQFHSCSIESFEPAHTYDVVFCLNAINHVASLPLCMDKLVQAVSPNGTLVISIDAHNYGWLKKIFRLLPGDILHPHQYDLKEYERMLTQRGCMIKETHLMKKELIFNYYCIIATR